VADEPEVLVMMKTSSDHVAALKTAIVTLHPYETPEVLVFSASDSLHAYASWVFAETHPEGA
jgi:periplasmic divalent cation tolerance protein